MKFRQPSEPQNPVVNPKGKAIFEHGQEVSVTFDVDDVVIVRND